MFLIKMYMALNCMRQILVFNAISTIVTDMECNIMIDRLPLGRGTELGQSVNPENALHISNYYIIIICVRRGCHPPSSQCFDTDVDYYIHLLLKSTVTK